MSQVLVKYFYFLVFTCLLLLFQHKSFGQHFDFGLELGIPHYFGELSHSKIFDFNEKGPAARSFLMGFGNQKGTFLISYSLLEINGADSFSNQDENRRRNLQFRAPIIEFGLSYEYNLLSISKSDYTRLRPLLIIGLNMFYFNPQTLYQNEWVQLQPLGTEGQGSSFYPDRKKYNLTQFSIPLGMALKYDLSENLWIGMGCKFRKTFTDYLDDVSTSYADLQKLSETNGILAAELSFRGDEIIPDLEISDGQLRGNSKTKDWYLTAYITLGLRFKDQYIDDIRNVDKKATVF